MSNVFGQLTHFDTPIHRIDPRVKFFGLIALMVVCFLNYGNYANRFIILGALALIIYIIMLLGKVSLLSLLKNLKGLWIMMIFLLIIFVFVPSRTGSTDSYHEMFRFNDNYIIYWEGLFQTLHVFLRLVLMVALTLILTSTTEPMDITYALEWYLYPLKLLRFPTQIITMIISLALRFIPTLLGESQKIMKAQKSRGVDYDRGFLSQKIKSITTLIVPLLISCFSKSTELSLAMVARGYDPYAKRTSYKILKFRKYDAFALTFILIILATFITLSCLAIYYPGADNFLRLFFGIEAF